jgi:ABC-2 type transport system ATP-binding protein
MALHAAASDEKLVIEISNFGMSFGAKEVIRNLTFNVKRGEVFGFLGANGAGKTTTIRTLLGLHEPTRGKLLVDGRRYTPSMSRSVGYLPEERGLYRNEPVLETMVYFGILHGLSRDEATSQSKAYLDRVGLGDKVGERLVKLSGGQQQKVQLGVTIMHEPSLMILDEPTEALDPVNRSLLMDIIDEQRQKGATVLLVTHRMDEVEQLCDRIALLKDGELAEYGTIDEVKNRSGEPIIAINYSGKLPTHENVYKISKHLPHYAELIQTKDVSTDEVLKYLADSKDLHISLFEIRQKSLNDIFLELYKDTRGSNG